MKKIFTFLFAIALSLNMLAQCPYTTAFDFTATDCHGQEVHLFDILDGGQYVLIDFFYYSCSACNQTAPSMVQAYQALGCNKHEVFFMEISDRDSDALCQTWVNNYGVEYPTISGAAGGSAINDQYGIGAYPTVILIAPDRSIVIQDLWPINNAQTVINRLQNYGIQQHDCSEPVPTGEVVFSTDSITLNVGGCIEEPGMFKIYNETTADLLIEDYTSSVFSFACQNTEVFSPENDIKGMTIAPSDSLMVYVWAEGLLRDEVWNDTLWLVTSFGNYNLPVVINYYDGTNEINANNFAIFPNPAKDFVKIFGDNLDKVMIFNMIGQKVEEFEVENNELNISISNFENGVYFVKVGETTRRFVITH